MSACGEILDVLPGDDVVSREDGVVSRIFSYRVALAVRHEVCSPGRVRPFFCQDTLPSIPFCHALAEPLPTGAHATSRGHGFCLHEIRISWEHVEFLFIRRMVVQVAVERTCGEVGIVVYSGDGTVAGQVLLGGEISTGSNDDPDNIAYPLVWLQREVQCIESVDGEGETIEPRPVLR